MPAFAVHVWESDKARYLERDQTEASEAEEDDVESDNECDQDMGDAESDGEEAAEGGVAEAA